MPNARMAPANWSRFGSESNIWCAIFIPDVLITIALHCQPGRPGMGINMH